MRYFTATRTSALAAGFGEGPVWYAGAVWYCDMPNRRVIRYDPVSGGSGVRTFGTIVACLGVSEGGLLAGTEEGFAFLPDDGTLETLDDRLSGMDGHRMNDGTTDRQGRFLAGSLSTSEHADGAVFTLGRSAPLLEGFRTTNGLALSPDGRTLHVSDSHPSVQAVWRCAYDPDTGAAGPREPYIDFTDLPGRPDGAAMDVEGGYWIACIDGGRVCRFRPDGTMDAVVEVPATKTSKPCFGGPDMRTMFITTATSETSDGGLYAVSLPVAGCPSVCARRWSAGGAADHRP